MRYEKGHKEATHQRILELAASRFRKEGIAAVGVANLMGELGLTQGGFYHHFASKDDLVREALGLGLERVRERLRNENTDASGGKLPSLVNSYLSASHRDKIDRCCMLTTLAIEASRSEGPVRAQMSEGIAEMVKLVSDVLPTSLEGTSRESKAMAVLSCLVGAMILARTTNDPLASERFLETGRHAAAAIAESAAAKLS